jgi:hypothetical protein
MMWAEGCLIRLMNKNKVSEMNNLTTALQDLCAHLGLGELAKAKSVAREHYPLSTITPTKRSYKQRDLIRTALRDGFIDRYSEAGEITRRNAVQTEQAKTG